MVNQVGQQQSPFSQTGKILAEGLTGFITGRGLTDIRQEAESKRLSSLQARDKARLDSIVQGALQVKQIQSPQQKLAFMLNRRAQLAQAGLSTQDTDEGIAMLQAGDVAGFEQATDQAISVGQQMSGGAGGIQQAIGIPGVGFQTLGRGGQVDLKLLTPEQQQQVLRAQEAEAERKARAAGLKTRATEESKIATAEELAGETAAGKAALSRLTEDISLGRGAAKGIPILRRSLELLKRVKTGGLQSVQLAASNLFGVTGADEAELSANLGRSVLSQLKTIFGSEFTEKEGARLEKIEAGFGKSTKGNESLLKQALQIAEEAAKRGIKAATSERVEDFEAAQTIKEMMDFTIDPSTFEFGVETAAPAVSEEDIQFTMQKHGMTREQVLQAIGGQ